MSEAQRAYRKPDIEFRRKWYGGTYGTHIGYRTYGHIYWRPLIIVVLGRVLLGRKHLRRSP